MIERRHLLKAALLTFLFFVSSAVASVAAQSSSAHYQVDQVFFGSGGQLDSSSTNYQTQQALGELVVGNSASTNYQVYGGYNTTDVPLLELTVNGGSFNLGTLSTASTASVSTTFSVRNYVSHGYVVYINGTAPTSPPGVSNHTLSTMSSLGCSVPGTEQFGINLTANTTGVLNGCTAVSVGSAPVQYPNNTFSFGQVTTNYGTANKFKYTPGDEIAYSNTSTGQTNYTISAIANISTTTPAETYSGSLVVIVVPTF